MKAIEIENNIIISHTPESEPEPEHEHEHEHEHESEHRDSSSHGIGNGISIGGNNSAFNRVQRITLPVDEIRGFQVRNLRQGTEQTTQRIAPGVERIPGETSSSRRETDLELESQGVPRTTHLFERDLPHAYPVDNNTTTLTATTTQEPIDDEPSNQNDNIVEEIASNNSNNVNEVKRKKIAVSIIVSFITLNALVVISILTQIPSREEEIKTDKNLNGTLISHNYTDVNITDSTYNNSSILSHQSNQNNHSLTECFTDPLLIQRLEWEAYERGDDPSIPRTYHFCPNSIMNVYDFNPIFWTFIHTTGDIYPLFIFRSNVNILCGFDGDYSNNCTFTGGFFHIVLRSRPMFTDYDINDDVENVTIEGFRFTGARYGSNIALRANQKSSAIIKNCRFDNNHDMSASLYTAFRNTSASTTYIQNCTFENNSFSYNPSKTRYYDSGAYLSLRAVGTILAYPITSPDAVLSIHISGCLFQNNTFFTDSDYVGLTSSAVINMFYPVVRMIELEVKDTYFVGNKGYSSGLILFSGNDDAEVSSDSSNIISQVYSSNTFCGNVASEQYAVDCVVNDQILTPAGTGDSFWIEIRESCADYLDAKRQECINNDIL